MSEPHPQSPSDSTQPADPAQAGAGDGASQFVLTLPDDPASKKDWLLWCGILAILAFVAFAPAIAGKFIWDDDHHILGNVALRSWHGLFHAWIPPIITSQYYPLTHTTFFIEHNIWGAETIGYHIVNILLHVGSTILIWRLLRRLGAPAPWLVAALWAIHPLQVETVCWISERKNVLAGVLYFGSMWYFLDFIRLPNPDRDPRLSPQIQPQALYPLSLGLFLAALLAKTVACVLPPVLIVILWWQNRLTVRNALATIPYFVLGLVMGLVTVKLETSATGLVHAVGSDYNQTAVERVLLAGRAIWFYAGKLGFPLGLSFNYPRVIPATASPLAWLGVVSVVAIVVALIAMSRRIGRGPAAAVMYFVIALFPALGFINVFPFRYSFVADHFQYLAGVGLIALAVGVAQRILARPASAGDKGPVASNQRTVVAVATLILMSMALGSWLHSRAFSGPIALWEDTLNKNPQSWLAQFNLASELTNQATRDINDGRQTTAAGDSESAKAFYTIAGEELNRAADLLNQSRETRPDYPITFASLGLVQFHFSDIPGNDKVDRLHQAEALLETAVDLEEREVETSHDPLPYLALGETYLVEARYEMALLPPIDSNHPTTAPSTHPSTKPSTTKSTWPTSQPDAQPSTRPSTQPSTRPKSPDEAHVADLFNNSIQAYTRGTAVLQMDLDRSPGHRDRDRQRFAAAFNALGDCFDQLSVLAQRCDDVLAQNILIHKAAELYLLSIKVNPNNEHAHYQLALCYAWFIPNDPSRTAFDQARHHLLETLKINGNNVQAYNEYGALLAEYPRTLDDLKLAIVCYQEVIRLNPDFPGARQHLQSLLAMYATASTRSSSTTRSTTALSTTEPSTTAPSGFGPGAKSPATNRPHWIDPATGPSSTPPAAP